MNKKDYASLAYFGRRLLGFTILEEGLPLISEYSRNITKANRCSIFVYDRKNSELWTTIADGVERIIIEADKGIVGQSLKQGKIIIENDVSKNKFFLKEIDNETGFKTKNVIVAPVFDTQKKVIGVLQLLNKEGGFTEDDKTFVKFFTIFISTFIALAPTSLEDDRD